jgi:hypothetical protein
MSRNSNKAWLGVVILFLFTGSSSAQTLADRHSKSILDYYLLLPHKYLSYLTTDSQQAREAAIQVKNLDGGFLKSGIVTDEVSTTLALFKRSDGSNLIAVENRSCPAMCASNLNLLTYANDQWVDVTYDVLPAIDGSAVEASLQKQYLSRPDDPSRQSQLIYNLRKGGESIEVNEHWSGMVLGEFDWANDAFTFKSEEAARSNYAVLAATDNPAEDRLEIIGIDPESPASLPLNGHLRIKIAYQLKSGKYCFIRVKPVVLEQRLPDDFTNGSMRYKPGSGVTTAYFGVNNQAHIDLLKVMMVDEQQKPILTLTYNIDANWTGTRDCPKFHVECFPNVDSSGAVLACMVYPSGLPPGKELTYRWNLSTGSIASGQGTRRITVNLSGGTETETMKAELEIGNLLPTCERKASFTMPITSLIRPKK